MFKLVGLCLVVFFLSACQSTGERVAQNSSAEEVVDEDGVQYTCRLERQIGSNFRRRVCTTAEDAKLNQEGARDTLERVRSNSRGHIEGN